MIRLTCIVAITDGKTVFMGGDRFTTDGNWGKFIDGSPKIAAISAFGRLEFLVGCAGDGRCCDVVLSMTIREEDIPKAALDRWSDRDAEFNVREILVDAIRSALRARGALMTDETGQEKGCSAVLVGHMGRLFVIGENFSVSVITEDHVAVGAAKEYAFGSLVTTKGLANDLSPNDRLKIALLAAQKYNITVSEPFDFLELDD